jgi:hypothetical protein
MIAAAYPFVLTLLLQWIAGFGVLASVRSTLPRSIVAPIALLLGAFLQSLIVVAADLSGVGLSFTTVSVGLGLVAVATHARVAHVRAWYASLLAHPHIRLRMYDVVAYTIAAYLVFVGMWAAYYWPVTPFDAMAGIDLMARQTVQDGAINNSVLTDPALAGRLSNQPFYAPFAMLQQVIYRLMGWPFGQVWLAVTSFCFYWTMWALFRRHAHPFIANILGLLLIMVPEIHGYTYLLQTDLLNAVYVAIGVIILGYDVEHKQTTNVWISALFLAAGCWSRTETIIVLALGLLATYPFLQRALQVKGALGVVGRIAGVSVAVFALWHVVYFYGVFPVRPDSGSELLAFSIDRFATVVAATVTDVLADMGLWGWTMPLLIVVVVVSLIQKRSVGDLWTLCWIAAILLALEFVGTLFASAVVSQTIRRGVFKLIPLMYLFMARSPMVAMMSDALQRWEAARGTPPTPARKG